MMFWFVIIDKVSVSDGILSGNFFFFAPHLWNELSEGGWIFIYTTTNN